MSGLEALYQELILDHAKRRVGFGLAEADTAHSGTSHQRNPICGDEITLRARVDGDAVSEVTWEGSGCSISQASASMLAEISRVDADGAPRTLTQHEASALIARFREALRSRGTIDLDEDEFGDAAALSGVSKYTARVKCAMLAWVALEDAMAQASA